MKSTLILLLAVSFLSLNAKCQEELSFNFDSICKAAESNIRIDKRYSNYYIQNTKDTTYYTEFACVHDCKLTTPIICLMKLRGVLANGFIIDFQDRTDHSIFAKGKYSSGIFIKGEILEYDKNNFLQNKRKVRKGNVRTWIEYHKNGKIKSRTTFTKYGEPNKLFLFDLNGRRLKDSCDTCLVYILPIEAIIEIDTPSFEDSTIYEFADEIPTFPGGQEKYLQFVKENLKWPNYANVQGNVYLSFVVEKDGSITNIKVIKGLEKDFDAEAIRIIKLMPKWNPGKQNGKIVRVRITNYVKFKPY